MVVIDDACGGGGCCGCGRDIVILKMIHAQVHSRLSLSLSTVVESRTTVCLYGRMDVVGESRVEPRSLFAVCVFVPRFSTRNTAL